MYRNMIHENYFVQSLDTHSNYIPESKQTAAKARAPRVPECMSYQFIYKHLQYILHEYK